MAGIKVHKTIAFPQDTWKMLETLKPVMGQSTMNGVIFAAVAEAYSKRFPAYKSGGPSRETKAEKEKREREELMEEKRGFVEQMDGTIFDINGIPHVKYYTYDRGARYEQQTPLEMIDEDIVARQYQPDKKTVDNYKKTGRASY